MRPTFRKSCSVVRPSTTKTGTAITISSARCTNRCAVRSDAALYWFCRMLDGGEEPPHLARRIVRMAVEDIGLADPNALVHSRAAAEAYEQQGRRKASSLSPMP